MLRIVGVVGGLALIGGLTLNVLALTGVGIGMTVGAGLLVAVQRVWRRLLPDIELPAGYAIASPRIARPVQLSYCEDNGVSDAKGLALRLVRSANRLFLVVLESKQNRQRLFNVESILTLVWDGRTVVDPPAWLLGKIDPAVAPEIDLSIQTAGASQAQAQALHQLGLNTRPLSRAAADDLLTIRDYVAALAESRKSKPSPREIGQAIQFIAEDPARRAYILSPASQIAVTVRRLPRTPIRDEIERFLSQLS